MKLYDKTIEDWFFRINLNQSYKTITVINLFISLLKIARGTMEMLLWRWKCHCGACCYVASKCNKIQPEKLIDGAVFFLSAMLPLANLSGPTIERMMIIYVWWLFDF